MRSNRGRSEPWDRKQHAGVGLRGALSEGKAHLESDRLIFRGASRLSIPFSDIRSLESKEGKLEVTFSEGAASFDLGPLAERWEKKIRHLKSRIDKFGVKPNSRVVLVGKLDETFLEELRSVTSDLSEGGPPNDSDIIFLRVEGKSDLKRLRSLQEKVRRNGAIWVIAPKGKPEIREADVMAAGKEAGLVDIKVVRFSETHTAHKSVIPVARR